jgi:DNA invertase Pin-like site-specific DNA recombinase
MRSPMRCSASNRVCSEAHSGRAPGSREEIRLRFRRWANPKTGLCVGRGERAGMVAKRCLRLEQTVGPSTREQRPGLASLMDYAREVDAIVVVGIDRLGRNAADFMSTIRELGERGIVLRSLREGIDTSNATGRMVAGVLASLAELELELGRERRAAARDARKARGQSIGRPKALDKSKAALAQRMHANGESASTIAATLGVSRGAASHCNSVVWGPSKWPAHDEFGRGSVPTISTKLGIAMEALLGSSALTTRRRTLDRCHKRSRPEVGSTCLRCSGPSAETRHPQGRAGGG